VFAFFALATVSKIGSDGYGPLCELRTIGHGKLQHVRKRRHGMGAKVLITAPAQCHGASFPFFVANHSEIRHFL
jgi:hypothetical protein